MKIKLDENLPSGLAVWLKASGHQADTVADERLLGADDDVLWSAVQADRRFFITKDLGFSNIRKYPVGSHFGVLVLRLGDLRMVDIVNRVKDIFQSEAVEQWAGCCVVATEWKVRVTKPLSY
jgi:predicted nuclease of predicted toxin-antitoxin system